MALLSTLAKPELATCSLTGEFFESLRKQFMDLESPLDISSKQMSSIKGIHRPTQLPVLFRRCPECPSFVLEEIDSALYYCFRYHFVNHRISQRLCVDLLYGPEASESAGWDVARYAVDDVICRPLPPIRVAVRPQRCLHDDVLVECLAFLDPDRLEASLLVCRVWYRDIEANGNALPLRSIERAELHTRTASSNFTLTYTLLGFTFCKQASLQDLGHNVRMVVRRCHIDAFVLSGHTDDNVKSSLTEAFKAKPVIRKLEVSATSTYVIQSILALCAEAVRQYQTTVLGLYSPTNVLWTFNDAQLIYGLTRLELSVPNMDCVGIGGSYFRGL